MNSILRIQLFGILSLRAAVALSLIALLVLPGPISSFEKPVERSTGGWAFLPIKRPLVPQTPERHKAWVRNPIDAFVLEKLLANGLVPSPEADRQVLGRRVAINLTGLPLSTKELEAFVNDPAADAYEKLVDRLLASPRYGVRWARHWLDVAHYADSHGQDQDRFRWPRPPQPSLCRPARATTE